MNLQIQKGKGILRKISNKSTAKHFVVKLHNTKEKRKQLERGKNHLENVIIKLTEDFFTARTEASHSRTSLKVWEKRTLDENDVSRKNTP